MDSSMSKALIIAAGVLLAMIVISFMAYSFRQLGSWATEQDQALLVEQKDKFNKEYEAYDKDLMYGVDVISCLNKAMSNNEQITNTRYVTGDTYDNSYEVTVKVKLTKKNQSGQIMPLEESITVYHIVDNKERAYRDGTKPNNAKIGDAKFSFIENNTDYYREVTNFKANNSLETITQSCKKSTCIEYNITKDKNAPGEEEIRDLLSVTNTISEVKKNLDEESSSKEDGWTKAEFKSALYDLKTRKFTCSNLTYDANTGRVNYIEFTEM